MVGDNERMETRADRQNALNVTRITDVTELLNTCGHVCSVGVASV